MNSAVWARMHLAIAVDVNQQDENLWVALYKRQRKSVLKAIVVADRAGMGETIVRQESRKSIRNISEEWGHVRYKQSGKTAAYQLQQQSITDGRATNAQRRKRDAKRNETEASWVGNKLNAPTHGYDNRLTARIFNGDATSGTYVGGMHYYLDGTPATFRKKKDVKKGDTEFSNKYNNWHNRDVTKELDRSEIF
ncbi:hypothetical protein BDN70DRAFT_900749 [Pholiota conissans]|uniref:Uncharacterized protein n=1 Tax=Pholiota conissans TaxID=109636 RepID=A0A9P5YNG0_9AGAR|nr:hypothetical protein BDN70DRAFT_900749 [Pholiota conissans]